jgi:ppGpp synthetase/RelA/SpoT-type nucleotidyltranferase
LSCSSDELTKSGDGSTVAHYVRIFSTRAYSFSAIDKAGDQLVSLHHDDPARDEAIEVINNWRTCHAYPLSIVKMTLLDRAKTSVNPNVLVAQRIKRLSSIALKLQQNPSMRLSRMQDIGGCRAVLKNPGEMEWLLEIYLRQQAKHPKKDRPTIRKVFDYVGNPKADGYRGIHIVMDFFGPKRTVYNGQMIEIQLRSKLQHAWATAVETCETFTGQALKSKIKNAKDSWIRFFVLMSSAIAARENRPIVPGTLAGEINRRDEIRALEAKERIIPMLKGWGTAIRVRETRDEFKDAEAFLLRLDATNRMLKLSSYKKEEMQRGYDDYQRVEKETEADPNIQVVLVSSESLANLRRAYPNYFVDTDEFIKAIEHATA